MASSILCLSFFPHAVRWILYGMTLVLTGGKLKFWVLPNLDNEKMGFFGSFRPFHSVEWVKVKKKKSSRSDSSADVVDTAGNSDEVITREEAGSAEGGNEEADGSSDGAAPELQSVDQH